MTRAHVAADVLLGIGVLGTVLKLVFVVPIDISLGTWESPYLLFLLLNVVVGWVLARRRPDIPIGWLLLATGAIEFFQGPATAIGLALRGTDPRLAGWVLELGARSGWTWVPTLGILFILIPLRFPTGRLPSARWRWLWWTCVGFVIVASVVVATVQRTNGYGVPNPTRIAWGGAVDVLYAVIPGGLGVAMLGALVSLILRYRRGTSVERAQLRWFLSAVVVVAVMLLIGGVENAIFGDENARGIPGLVANALDFVSDLAYCLIPIAILIAVLRRGLYSIDRIISRTAAYAVVTVSTVAIYAAIVVLGSVLVPDLPSVGVAAATLAAAAVFLPLLRAVRRTVDRRFNRAQYDAQEVVDAFGERIRTGVDPDAAGTDFVAAVQRALQPSAVGIWRRDLS